VIEIGARRVERSDADGRPLLVLETNEREPRQLTVPMSRPEAHMLAHELRGETTLPGLSFDLLADMMHALGGDLAAVELAPGADERPMARLRLESHEGRAVVPARLGLAVALAARLKVPLLLDEALLSSGADPAEVEPRSPFRDSAGDTLPAEVPDVFLRAFDE
jgi:bifunctional DNase/RNase